MAPARLNSRAAFVLLLTLFWTASAAALQSPTPVRGVGVHVQDGDSFELADRRGRIHKIRLHGIDAPERSQTCRVGRREVACGEEAASRLQELVLNQTLSCTPIDVSFDRLVATCRIGRQDIAAILVQEGHAIAYRAYARDYVRAEGAARRANRGIWQGSMETPACYRRPGRPGCPCPIQTCIYDQR